MTSIDFFLLPIYLLIIVGWINSNKVYKGMLANFYTKGAYTKLAGSTAFGMIYHYYYGGGDTINFYHDASIIIEAFKNNIIDGISLLISNPGEFNSSSYSYTSKMFFYNAAEEYFIIKICALLGLITFNTYSVTSLLFALYVFTGSWLLYSRLISMYPSLHKEIGFSIFFIPSVVFWGSGILKDTWAIGSLMFFTSSAINIAYFNKRTVKTFGILFLSAYFIFHLKSYILLSLFLPISLWMYKEYQSRIKSKLIKVLIMPLIALICLGGGYIMTLNLAAKTNKYSSWEAVEKRIDGFQADHGKRTGGSAYHLDVSDKTPLGMLKAAPSAINVALFRPYLWEANNIVMIVSALESLGILIITLYVFFRAGPLNFIWTAFTNPEALLCFSYTLIMAFVTGYTAFNFGALVRFKIPFLPFYGIGLAIIYGIHVKKIQLK